MDQAASDERGTERTFSPHHILCAGTPGLSSPKSSFTLFRLSINLPLSSGRQGTVAIREGPQNQPRQQIHDPATGLASCQVLMRTDDTRVGCQLLSEAEHTIQSFGSPVKRHGTIFHNVLYDRLPADHSCFPPLMTIPDTSWPARQLAAPTGANHPAFFLDAGEQAWRRVLEFFTARVRNVNTRAAYAQTVA